MQVQSQTRKVHRDVEFKFSEQDFAAYAKQLGDASNELNKVKDEYKEKMDPLKKTFNELVEKLEKGKETKNVEVLEERDFQTNTIRWKLDDSVVEERAMSSDERQTEMFKSEQQELSAPSEESPADVAADSAQEP